jgi:uncharacterized protein YcbX
MKGEYAEIGIVTELWIHPVKSMEGESRNDMWAGWHGASGDRRYAFVREGDTSGFPFFTMRDAPKLAQYKGYLEEPGNASRSAVRVRTPGGKSLPVESDELKEELSALAGKPVQLLHHWGGLFDASDLAIITTTTLCSLQRAMELQEPLDIRRFRPNIVIQTETSHPYPEDRWVGDLLVFGERSNSARVRLNRRDERCMVVNVNPETGKQDPNYLKQIVQGRKNLLGVYGVSERPGGIEVGDKVFLVKR